MRDARSEVWVSSGAQLRSVGRPPALQRSAPGPRLLRPAPRQASVAPSAGADRVAARSANLNVSTGFAARQFLLLRRLRSAPVQRTTTVGLFPQHVLRGAPDGSTVVEVGLKLQSTVGVFALPGYCRGGRFTHFLTRHCS